MPDTSPTDVPSTDNQSMEGCGLPDAEQSSQPPLELENSSRVGGSMTKLGPRRCESNPAITPGDKRVVRIGASVDKLHVSACDFNLHRARVRMLPL